MVMDDDELISAVARADEGALRELFERNAPWLAARLGRVLAKDVVEDVLQETFVAVWRGAGSYRPQGRPGAWLWGIARRQAALWTRRHGRPPPTDSMAYVAGTDPQLVAVDRMEMEQAVASLGPAGGPERELWRLLFEEDRSVTDVAARLGIPAGTVKSRAHRLRLLLRAALREET
jgi:RNA polymerase sigma-70 factor, ECF subfamily